MSHHTRSKSRAQSSSSSSGNSIELRARSDDAMENEKRGTDLPGKENIQNSAFQPPSPLTSRRKMSKGLTSAKMLSPNRTSQWSRSRESSLASMQPRSSPIHTSQSYSQERDSRTTGQSGRGQSRASATMKQDHPGYTFHDFDMMNRDDNFGPPILDLGSFDTTSPPRDAINHRRPPERGSPPYSRNIYRYRSSPPPGYYHDHSASHPGYGYPPVYHSGRYQGDLLPWSSPQAYDFDRPPRLQRSSYDGRNASPIPKKSRRWEHTTPEKEKPKVRSPFRSPLADPGSAKKFKKSPIWGASVGTPSIGMLGSFGMMDTPGAQLDGFSPMGPSFTSFEDDSPAIPMEGEVLDGRLSLAEEGDRVRPPPSIKQRLMDSSRADSPGLSFVNEMDSIPGSMPLNSPVRSSRGRTFPLFYDDKSSNDMDDDQPSLLRAHSTSHPPSAKRPNRPVTTKRQIFPSPLAPSHHGSANRRSPWYDNRHAPGPVRLEIGDMGAKNLETRRSFEGINSMVRGNTPLSRSNHSHLAHPGAAYDRNRATPYQADLNTPSKHGFPAPNHRQSAQSHHPSPYDIPPSASGRKPVSVSTTASRFGSNLATPSSLSGKVTSTPSEKSTASSSERRNPCNCKKSKCLKLYCECFAAELFCDSCNCNDCRNTKEYEDIRNKAIKDTRAKNPNAFKPRIIARTGPRPSGATPQSAHNMGCKCKRSECLKKYCECFQAGVMCGSKCKCVDCLNYVGSQALIDKRRKIKDHRGAEFAMQTADDAWKGKSGPPLQPRPINTPSSASTGRHAAPSPGPSRHLVGPHGQHHPHHPMIRPSPPAHHMYSPRSVPHYVGIPPMGHPPLGYPSMGIPMHQSTLPNHHAQHTLGEGSSHGNVSVATTPRKNLSRAPMSTSKSSSSETKTVHASGISFSNAAQASHEKIYTIAVTDESREDAAQSTSEQRPLATPTSSHSGENADALSSLSEDLCDKSTASIKAIPCADARSPKKAHIAPDLSTETSIGREEGLKNQRSIDKKSQGIPGETAHTPKEEPKDITSIAVNEASSLMEVPATDQVQISRDINGPRTPGVRLGYDPYSSKLKRHLSPGQNEETLAYFGELPEQPKTTALAVFSFLSNEEIYNAGLVCKRWSKLAMDEELWQF